MWYGALESDGPDIELSTHEWLLTAAPWDLLEPFGIYFIFRVVLVSSISSLKSYFFFRSSYFALQKSLHMVGEVNNHIGVVSHFVYVFLSLCNISLFLFASFLFVGMIILQTFLKESLDHFIGLRVISKFLFYFFFKKDWFSYPLFFCWNVLFAV